MTRTMTDDSTSHSASLAARDTARAALRRDRWFAGASPRAMLFRWLLSRPAQFMTNGPALRLPGELRLDADARVLDIGCGRGALLRTFDDQLRLRTAPVGIELSRAALTLAAHDDRDARRTRLVHGTASCLPFHDGAFTFVTSGYVAKHLEDGELLALLREVHRVLAPGGLAVVWDFGPSGDRRLDGWNARVLSVGNDTPRLRSSATLRRMAGEAGFEFARDADLRPFLLPPIARASVLLGRPPEGWREAAATPGSPA